MKCRVCDSDQLVPVIDLGEQPWCNHFLTAEQVGKEPYYPLAWSTAKLARPHNWISPSEIMFGDHTYLSGDALPLSEHFAAVQHEVDQRFGVGKEPKAVLDIGSNDGTQLKHFQALGWDVLGVESSETTAGLAIEHRRTHASCILQPGCSKTDRTKIRCHQRGWRLFSSGRTAFRGRGHSRGVARTGCLRGG